MLAIWARGLRPRLGLPLNPRAISLKSSNPRKQQVLVSFDRDYRSLRHKADFGVVSSLTSLRIWQTSYRFNSTQSNITQGKTSKLGQLLPSPILSKTPENVSSLRKIFALAKPERKPLFIAIGLLLVSSAVSMSVPFTIGKLIDFFSSANPVRMNSWHKLPCVKSRIANTIRSFYLARLRSPSNPLHSGGSCKCWSCNADEIIRSASR